MARRRAAAGQPHPDPSQRLFEETLAGKDGWGISRGDVLVAAVVVLVAALAAFALWLGGSRGAPGDIQGDGTASIDAASVPAESAGVSSPTGEGRASQPEGVCASKDVLYAVIQNTDGYRRDVRLDQDASVTVEGSKGTNVVEVSGGRVRCATSDCSNQVCVETGWVSDAGQMIVCLPHEMTVQIVADPADAVPLV